MNHASLFSGIGGFDLAAQWMGWNNIFQVEWDSYAQKVLAKNFLNVDRYEDIKEFDATKYKGAVDIISGGFPCQPFSTAGKRKGTEDDRYLWPEMLRVIRELQPSYVVGENVAGLISMENGKTLDRILADLENEGYTVESFVIPACAIEAWHRRDRIWIIAYALGCGNKPQEKSGRTESQGDNEYLQQSQWGIKANELNGCNKHRDVTNTNSSRRRGRRKKEGNRTKRPSKKQFERCGKREIFGQFFPIREPSFYGTTNGFPNWMDRNKGLGNAIVPQVAYEIFKTIELVNNI